MQLDLLNDTEGGALAHPDESRRRQELAGHERRRKEWEASWLVRNALTPHGLYGYPNLLRNPDGDWTAPSAAKVDRHHHDDCWPALWLINVECSGPPTIFLCPRSGCAEHLAIKRAAEVLMRAGLQVVVGPREEAGYRWY